MVNVTLSISDALYARMREHSEYKWSEVARQAIEEKISEAELIDDLKDFAKAEKKYKTAKTISHKELIKRLGLENEL